MSDLVELLFFDTFAHENTEELNLDLVQFPKPVFVTEVRIIPLGARVQADFPGGVRLGATNPSQFQIEFFVNDLGKPGASTFETLGGFEYDQNGCINLECSSDETVRKIPTDGLVLKGWYTTITLAVYGTLTNNIIEPIVQPPVNPAIPPQPNTIADVQQICPVTNKIEPEWQPQEVIQPVPMEYTAQPAVPYHQPPYVPPPEQQPYQPELIEYYGTVKDPRGYHHPQEGDWDTKTRRVDVERDRDRDRDRDRSRDLPYQKTGSTDREHLDRREKRYSRSGSHDRDRHPHAYREDRGEHDHEWSEHDRTDYHVDRPEHEWTDRERDRDRDRDRDRERGHDRDRERGERCYKHDENYRRSYSHDERVREREREREERKRPRTPPIQSPKRPHTPQVVELKEVTPEETVQQTEPESVEEPKTSPAETKEVRTSPNEDTNQLSAEEFEPILSDEDILDDMEHYQDVDFDYTAYTNNDDIIKLFTPGVTELKKYPKPKNFSVENNTLVIDETLRVAIGIADDYFKSSITKYEMETFDKLNTEIKEEFIHLCEKLTTTIGAPSVFCDIAKLYVITKSMNPQSLSAEDKELAEQVDFVMKTLTDWLKIALNYEMANLQDQPAYIIRHIKCGVKLAIWCCKSVEYIKYLWQNKFNIHQELLHLYEQEFMALSIKLMVLNGLDTYLQHRYAVEKFLFGDLNDSLKENGYYDLVPDSLNSGYKVLVKYMQQNPLVRTKFALASILKKLNLYEVLHKMHSILLNLRYNSQDISTEDINLITKSLNEILNYCKVGPFTLSQPKRFLPVSSQFEILRNDTYEVLVEYFKMFNLLQCFVLLLTYPSTLNLPLIKTPIFEIVSLLLENNEGLQYISENFETVNILLKCLLRTDEEVQYTIQECLEIKSHHLGLKIAYKLQALYHIEYLLDNGKKLNMDCDAFEVIDHLHGLVCLTFSHIGKVSVAEVLGLGNYMESVLQFIEFLLTKEKTEAAMAKISKSTGIAYIVDLIVFAITIVPNVQLMEKHSKILFQIMSQQNVFEESVCSKLNEIRPYMIPFENVTSLTYDDISPFVTAVKKYSETFPYDIGAVITSLRVIRHLGISKYEDYSNSPLANYVELKYKHVILQLFSLDGTSILSRLLQRICDYYEQPTLHSHVFVSNFGWQILNIIDPAVALLKQMLAYVVQCQNTKFKDLTTIPALLQTYTLLDSFPNTAAGYTLAQKVKSNIVGTLLVYTQPMSEEVSEKDSLTKTLWTQMAGETIKYITSSPHTFISGLLIFSELLPLPLPVQTREELTKDELSWIINLRRLWSAHLHPHSNHIQDMTNKLCISTQPQLLNLLRRICVQLSDLAANSALMVARGILDNVYNALMPKEEGAVLPCGGHVARLLNFMACLVTHGTIKCAVLHLIHTNSAVTLKTEEKYASLVPTFAQVLKMKDDSSYHIQAQECILSIIQSFCDIEITLMQSSPSEGTALTSEQYLANALPVKDHLLMFIHMMWEHLSNDNSFVTYLPIVRTLLLLTEHDYGFYHLKEYLFKKSDVFVTLLSKLVTNFSKDSSEYLSTLNTFVEFLRVCVSTDEETDSSLLYTPRKTKLSLGEMKTLIGWPLNEKPENHPLKTLEKLLKETVEENNNFESFLEGVSALVKLLEEGSTKDENGAETAIDTTLPAPDALLLQFSCRAIFSSTDACDERLTSRYWLAVPADENDQDQENVPCDLLEICRQCIRPEFNIVKEVERVCRISSSDNPDDKEKQLDADSMKMKKPFVSPMRARGFARTIPQRTDAFRSRPPNTSRPPSLHVDDFVALETCGAQPTGPTGYNKISRELLASTRIARGPGEEPLSLRSVQCSIGRCHGGEPAWEEDHIKKQQIVILVCIFSYVYT
nr:unnamed protein product [Callosobruchus chinensis]